MFRDEGGPMASTVGTSYQKFKASRSGDGPLVSTVIGMYVWWQTDFTLKDISVTSQWIDAQVVLWLSETVMVRLYRVQPDIVFFFINIIYIFWHSLPLVTSFSIIADSDSVDVWLKLKTYYIEMISRLVFFIESCEYYGQIKPDAIFFKLHYV